MVDSVEAQFSTDFANLILEQDPGSGDSPGPYATSAPGWLAMKAGTKYADLDVRVECWDAKPPPPEDEWQDQDVLPWRSIDGSEDAQLRAFDSLGDSAVSLRGLDRARVEVLAWGRNRYGYSTGPDDWADLPRERWLLRFWPDLDDLDALAGPPRRLIGREWLPAPRDGFGTAVQALETAGWGSSALADTPFRHIFQAIVYQRAAFRAEELPKPFLGWTWDTDAPRAGDAGDRLERVARAAGVEVLTYRDALEALIALGVLATVQTPDGQLLVPNPAPPISAWDIIEPDNDTGYTSPRALEYQEYRTISEDLLHQARWAKDGELRATPERIASRLGLSRKEVLGALNFLAGLGHRVEPLPGENFDTESTVTLGARPQR
jgi:hypothetical protein